MNKNPWRDFLPDIRVSKTTQGQPVGFNKGTPMNAIKARAAAAKADLDNLPIWQGVVDRAIEVNVSNGYSNARVGVPIKFHDSIVGNLKLRGFQAYGQPGSARLGLSPWLEVSW